MSTRPRRSPARARANGKKMTRVQELEAEANDLGMTVRTYSPGGGTRYRFFYLKGLAPNQSYFGPRDGVYTAIGLKEAHTFLRGVAR